MPEDAPTPEDAPKTPRTDYELIDTGVGRRLERFGPVVVDRPAPTAAEWRRAQEPWATAGLRFDAGGGWTRTAAPWPVAIDGLTLEVRPTSSGGLGVYPEHAANLAWVADQVQRRQASGPGAPPAVLNLFAHTGLVTLAAARAGAAVAHVDAARTAVAWARRNAELSGLTDRPIRWLVDDALAFVAREARRGRRYDGIVLDPPSFGHAGRQRWRIEEELPALLHACREIAAPDAFVLLTAHTTGLDADSLVAAVADALPRRRARISATPLRLDATSGAVLDLGWSVRLPA